MSEPIWSRHFAQDIAKILGFPIPETAADGKDEKLCHEGERLLEEITDHFRYLPGEQINWTANFARFLNVSAFFRRELDKTGGRPYGWPVNKLREVREYMQFLRDRHGAALPADESDEWSDEDRRDAADEVFRRLDEEDPYDWQELPKDKEASE